MQMLSEIMNWIIEGTPNTEYVYIDSNTLILTQLKLYSD